MSYLHLHGIKPHTYGTLQSTAYHVYGIYCRERVVWWLYHYLCVVEYVPLGSRLFIEDSS